MLPAPFWKWEGLVIADESGDYLAVMPIPLRQKRLFGLPYSWVVHQPFFCQFLSVFSAGQVVDPVPFLQVMQPLYRHGSILRLHQLPNKAFQFDSLGTGATQILNLSVGYDALYQGYSRDRKKNLKRALSLNWTIVESTDPEPLITLFCKNHTTGIAGGVAEWAYDILRNLVAELGKRKLMTLRYACQNGRIDAGALFVSEGNRIIYLFNAASENGRLGNARTLLIDQLIQEKAPRPDAQNVLIVDFESPEKRSVRDFYRSFGADEEPFYKLRWSRLNTVERIGRAVMKRFR